MRKVVICRVGNEEFAMDIKNVVSIERMQSIRPLPHTPSYFTGILDIREEIISVIDLRIWLGLPSYTTKQEERLIVVEQDSKRIGLIVDAATDVVDIHHENIHTLEGRESSNDNNSIIKLSNRLIVFLDVSACIKVV